MNSSELPSLIGFPAISCEKCGGRAFARVGQSLRCQECSPADPATVSEYLEGDFVGGMLRWKAGEQPVDLRTLKTLLYASATLDTMEVSSGWFPSLSGCGFEALAKKEAAARSAWFAAKLAAAFPGASSGEGVCLVQTGQSPAFAVVSESSQSAASLHLPAKCLSLYGDGVWYRLLDRQTFAWAAVKVDRLRSTLA